MKLNNQEIRNCIYSGTFNNLLKELNKNTEWMRLNKMKKDIGFRFTKEELILRFFAFYDQYNKYEGRLAKFLNEYMADNRNLDDAQSEDKRELFKRIVKIIFFKLFDGKAPTKTPISVIEATLVGIAKNIDKLENVEAHELKSKYNKLRQHKEFSDQKLSEGLSGKYRVTGRLDAAINIFSQNI